MKKILFYIFCILFLNSYGQNCPESSILVYPPNCDELPLIKVFEANFDGDSLDNSIWCSPYCWGPTNNGLEYNQIQNVIVNNGTIKLIAKKEPVTWVENNVTYSKEYTSGAIVTKKDFGWGIYEIRCKIPYGKGFWPAFWLWSNANSNNNEIDIFEYYYQDISGPDNRFHFTIHENGENCSGDWFLEDYSSEFHVFKLEWFPLYIKIYVDGVLGYQKYRFRTVSGHIAECEDLNNINSYYESHVFPDPYKPIMANLAISGSTNGLGLPPDNNTQFPGVFEIDYIRYFQPQRCMDTVIIDNDYIANLNPEIYNVELGDYIIINSITPIASEQNLHVVARKEISIKNNFISSNDGEFTFRIDPSICEEYNEVPLISGKNENSVHNLNNLKFRFNNKVFDIPIENKNCNFTPLNIKILNILGQIIVAEKIVNCKDLSINLNYEKNKLIFIVVKNTKDEIIYEGKYIDYE